ncbi:MAG TPA: hypothetical protein DCE56_21475 [Cyanobacteria bacterium UBA8553]|nr:hypothetical protein [Cyanobacteria bacterium UBA8553]HAJ63094.1 hypothetical protein [Cyanobacteria bacterium UBA8543]
MRKIFYLAPVMSLALILGVGVSLKTQARHDKEVTTTYYSNATYKKVVGEKTLPCGGGIIKWGVETQFYKKSSASCN